MTTGHSPQHSRQIEREIGEYGEEEQHSEQGNDKRRRADNHVLDLSAVPETLDDIEVQSIPTGGVIIAVSTNKMIMIPNHTGSKPRDTIIGVMIGTVATIMDKVSMKQPRIT